MPDEPKRRFPEERRRNPNMRHSPIFTPPFPILCKRFRLLPQSLTLQHYSTGAGSCHARWLMRILAVGGDEDLLNSVSVYFDLYWENARVRTASDGAQGIQMLQDAIPDMLILDATLPDMDGLELCREIQRQYVLPVILLASSDREEDLLAATAAHADDYVTKPFSVKELLARVWAVARRHRLPMWSEDSLSFMIASA